MDAKLDAEMAPEELNTIEIASNENVDARDVEIGIEKAPAKSETHISPDENEKGIYKADIDATRLLFGVDLPILEENIQLPAGCMSKIQKVPALLRQNPNFDRYCSPKMISFGPIHYHREQNGDLQLGQQLKYIWAFRYIKQFASSEEGGQGIEDAKRFLHGTVTQHLQELRNLFSKDVTQGYNNNEELVQMLFVDGCALLYFMINLGDSKLLMLKFDQMWCVWSDISLLENQLPGKLLDLLMTGSLADPLWGILVFKFLFWGLPKKKSDFLPMSTWAAERENKVPTHLLDDIRSYYSYAIQYRNNVVRFPWCRQICVILPGMVSAIKTVFRPFNLQNAFRSLFREPDNWHRYKNIGDLRKAGIQVKVSETDDISFTSNLFGGRLMLPGIVMNDLTPSLYHNLIAYEMCPDFHHNFEFCSYFSLMDSFIDDADDVKELRAAGVLENLLGSDEEVAKFFNELGHVLPKKYLLNDYSYENKYDKVRRQIHEHYRNKWKTWLAQLRSTYFNNPWSFIGFLAAVFALVLTFLQTWYTIHPKN